MYFKSIARYELNCKRPEVAQSYLDLAVRIDPEETLVGDACVVGGSGGEGCDGDVSVGGGGGGGGDSYWSKLTVLYVKKQLCYAWTEGGLCPFCSDQ